MPLRPCALSDARALHEQSSGEVEALLKSQEALSEKYRTEAKTIASRFDRSAPGGSRTPCAIGAVDDTKICR